jgi:hypothetical protein
MLSRRFSMRAGAAAAVLALVMGRVAPAVAAEWVPGYYGPRGAWHPGHWVGGYRGPPPEGEAGPPPGYAPGRVWIKGHYGPGGAWFPGHWAPA